MGDQDRHGPEQHPDHETEIEIEEAGDKGGEVSGLQKRAFHPWLAWAPSRRMRTAIGSRVNPIHVQAASALERNLAGASMASSHANARQVRKRKNRASFLRTRKGGKPGYFARIRMACCPLAKPMDQYLCSAIGLIKN
jgi:hypothetical protein